MIDLYEPMQLSRRQRDALLCVYTNDVPSRLLGILRTETRLENELVLDHDGNSVLHWAARCGRLSLVRLLISSGADTLRINNTGQTALMWTCQSAACYEQMNFPQILQLLADSITIQSFNGQTFLHFIVLLAKQKDALQCARYYLHSFVDWVFHFSIDPSPLIDVRDHHGQSALHLACQLKDPLIIEDLLKLGADYELPDISGLIPEEMVKDEMTLELFRLAKMRDGLLDVSSQLDERFLFPRIDTLRTALHPVPPFPQTRQLTSVTRTFSIHSSHKDMLDHSVKNYEQAVVCVDQKLKLAQYELENARKSLTIARQCHDQLEKKSIVTHRLESYLSSLEKKLNDHLLQTRPALSQIHESGPVNDKDREALLQEVLLLNQDVTILCESSIELRKKLLDLKNKVNSEDADYSKKASQLMSVDHTLVNQVADYICSRHEE
jgi:ankyrin repeat protein